MKNLNLIFGRKPVMDTILSGKPIDKVLLQQNVRGDFEKELRKNCKQKNIPLKTVPKERLARFGNGNHQGVVAFISTVPFYKLEDVIPGIFEKGEIPLLLLLDGITDVRNFGAIARTAEVMGVHAIVVSKKSSAEINAEAVKASAGALMQIPICRESSLETAMDLVRHSGIRILASDLKAEKKIFELDMNLPLAIVIGSEGEGIRLSLLRKADDCFIIPQKGSTDSLNVSVATGVMLYEVFCQRNRKLDKAEIAL